jgi:hypothetical protein
MGTQINQNVTATLSTLPTENYKIVFLMPSAQLNVLYYILHKYSATCFDQLYDHPLAI